MSTYTITLPLPPKEASPNARSHWGQRARAVSDYRFACYLALIAARNADCLPYRLQVPITIHMDFYLARKPGATVGYPRDADNARGSAKAAQDALQDAGMIESDSRRHVRMGATRLHTTKREHQGRACLLLTIEEAE